jgi:hypothetical protein
VKSNWDQAFRQVIIYEGGFVNHPKDPGGPTNLGITQATLSRYLGRNATIADVRALTKASVQPIYKKFFWDVLRCDDLPGGVDLAVYDFGVNSGTCRAARYLQSVVGVVQDGQIGIKTIAACDKYSAEEIVRRLVAKRRGFLMGLGSWQTFGKGWNRRLVSVLSTSLAHGTAEDRHGDCWHGCGDTAGPPRQGRGRGLGGPETGKSSEWGSGSRCHAGSGTERRRWRSVGDQVDLGVKDRLGQHSRLSVGASDRWRLSGGRGPVPGVGCHRGDDFGSSLRLPPSPAGSTHGISWLPRQRTVRDAHAEAGLLGDTLPGRCDVCHSV